jgi:hypothetical protein
MANEGLIGIFWLFPDGMELFYTWTERKEDGERYFDWLISSKDHAKEWESLGERHALDTLPRRFRKEYAALPRGRVSFSVSAECYVIYHGDWINDRIKAAICRTYRLEESDHRFEYDQHYDVH